MTQVIAIAPFERGLLETVSQIEKTSGDVGWTQAHFEKELTNPFSRFFVLKEGVNILGYGGYWIVAGEAQMTNLVIASSQRRRGLGTRLLSHLLTSAQADRCQNMTLEVRQSNAAALALYRKAGFTIQGRRPKMYTQPVEDAVMMEKKL